MEAILFYGGVGSKSFKAKKWHGDVKFTVERTPATIASINFRKYLLMHGMERSLVDSYSQDVLNMEKSRFMNMRTLAAVYVFMHENKIFREEDVERAYEEGAFNDDKIDRYIYPLLPEDSRSDSRKVYIRERRTNNDIQELEKMSIQIKFRATFVRYMMTVLKYRTGKPRLTKEEAAAILDNYHEILLEEQEDIYLQGTLSNPSTPTIGEVDVDDIYRD